MKKLTLLAIVSGLTASALTAAPNPQTNTNLLTGGTYYTLADGSRADLITSGSFTAADNVLRTAGANYAVAIFVDTDGAAFTGSNLTIYTGIKMDADGNPLTAGGDLATDPSQYVYSGTPGAKNINYNYGIIARNGAAVEVAAVNIMTFSHIEGNGLMAENARLIANNVAIVINTYSYANGGLAHNLGYLEIDGGTINTFNLNASEGGSGLTAWHSGTVVARHLTINAQIGANVYAGSVTVADSVIHADQKAYHTSVIPSGTGTVGQLDIINTVAVSDDVGLATEGGGSLVNISGGSLDAAGDLIISSGTGTKDLVLDRLTSATGSNALRVIGSNTTTVTVKHTDVSGQTQVSGTTTTTVTLDDSALTGDLTASEDATIAVTVSGSRSALLGDIEQNDRAVVTVILDDHATGRGGFNGGNLITDGDSAWTFDKDSHGNYGENNGTWNIGDYNVTFDNLTHTGTLTISVNSDTGDGGSIIVIGTADGDGTVHIDTTGNGQADPNQVLPGIVSGDGTEHWQWDPIDWGIDTIIKDGDHFIKQGTSSAGAVLNSAIAVQQSMWFAQQNSLLKRMGDLRYGARASRPLADKDVRVPYHSLIENIWLRSYGQQLNVGSQVSGKAYEQLIYGVDLGTDHKLTISA
ncbi:MAG: hypothetical protein LBK76_00850, partial [Verrucomicrobiales bacterium]|nr:hypothetical protein [Verrucomicrobiales bacterium]